MSKYKLGDFTVQNWNDWDKVPRDPVTIGTAIITAVGGSAALAATTIAFGITVAGVVGYIATSIVTSFLVNALMPKPKSPTAPSAIGLSGQVLTNTTDPTASQRYIYGTRRVGGTITFQAVSGTNNKFLHQVISIAGHEVEEIETIYFNGKAISINSSNSVTTARWKSQPEDDDDTPEVRVKVYTKRGTSSQNAIDLLVNQTQVNGNFRGRGIAYIYCRFEYDADTFADGIPVVTAKVKGKKVYDPRTGNTAFSQNAALIIRDFLVSNIGLNDKSANIDDTSFSAAANICDEQVTTKDYFGTVTQDRYHIDGIVDASTPVGEVLQSMTSACGGSLYWSTGKWKLNVAAYSSSVKTLTLDDFRGPINIDTKMSMRDQFNAVKGTFAWSRDNFVPQDYPKYSNDVFLAADNNVETILDLPLPFTISAARAQRLARLTLNRAREQLSVNADFSLAAFDLEVGDTVALTNSRYGWSAKEFEVTGWNFITAADGLKVNMSLKETSATSYAWNANEKLIENNDTDLPSPITVPEVGFTLDQELRIVNEQVSGVITVDITTDDPYANFFIVQYKKSSSSKYINAGRGNNDQYDILVGADGLYDVRVKAVNPLGVRGKYKSRSIEFTSFAPPPENVTNFSGNVVGNNLHLTWTPVSDLDLSHYKVRYTPRTSGATYSNSVDLVKKIARPANSAVVPAQTGTYFIKAVDKVGGLSKAATSFVVLIDPNNVEEFNAIVTLTENPNFNGARSDVVVLADGTGNYLALDTTEQFDSKTGDFDDAEGLFDGGAGDIVPSGIYYFNNSLDLGAKYTSRVRPTFNVDYIDYINDFDSVTGNFDDREGEFDGDPDQFDTTSAALELRHTDDDPSGTPTWSDWQEFILSDISARAMEFRVVLTSSSPSATPAVRTLAAEIDMPERVESQEDITFTGSTDITFPTAFKDTPAVGITLANLANGERYAITSKTRTGFTIQILTSGGSQSTNSVTLDYVAKGYGKELT